MILFNDKYLFPLFLEVIVLSGIFFKGIQIRGQLSDFVISGLDVFLILADDSLLLEDVVFVTYPLDGVVVIYKQNNQQECQCGYKIFVQKDTCRT